MSFITCTSEGVHRVASANHENNSSRIFARELFTLIPGRFFLLVGLGLLFYLINEHPQFQIRDGQLSAQVPLFPISIVIWHTGGWLLFSGILWSLLASRFQCQTPVSDEGICRIAIAIVALIYATEIGSRLFITGFFGLEQHLGVASILSVAACGGILLALLLRWPPTPPILIALLLSGGVVIRIFWAMFVSPSPQHSDNLFVIRLGLERFISGETPYAYFDFGTHTNPMPYLPWTFLSYVPPFLAGLDLRVTSFTLSLALIAALWIVFRLLRISSTVQTQLLLALSVLYVSPLSISLDEQAEFSFYNLMLVLTFSLIVLGRFRLAAVAYGFALGAMPVAVFCAVPLLCFALRTQPWRQVVVLGAIILGVAATPMLVFLIWDPQAFLWAVSYVPREAWGSLDRGLWAEGPWNAIVWHALGGWLKLVQGGLFLLFALVAWLRMRTVHDLLALSAGEYIALVLSGPYVGPHLVQVVLFLAVLAEAVNVARFDETSLHNECTIPALYSSPR